MDYLAGLWESLRDQHSVFAGVLSTLVLVGLAVVLRCVIGRALRRNENLPPEVRRRWLVQLRNGMILLLVLGIIVIWANELRVVAVSMFAVAVASVIATKELIQCLSGSLLKTVSRGFSIGDRIEINSLRGDVIDHNALTTTILEIGPNDLTQQHTGRAIVLPNSILLDKPVINETFTDDYVLHVFKVPISMDENWQQAEQALLDAARDQCDSFLEQARRHFQRLGRDRGLATMSVEPRVSVLIPKTGELELVVRIAVPARRKGRIEQAILRCFVSSVVGQLARQEEPSPPSPSSSSNDAASPRVADAA
jgi:small-conductance mechanosensitive channel